MRLYYNQYKIFLEFITRIKNGEEPMVQHPDYVVVSRKYFERLNTTTERLYTQEQLDKVRQKQKEICATSYYKSEKEIEWASDWLKDEFRKQKAHILTAPNAEVE